MKHQADDAPEDEWQVRVPAHLAFLATTSAGDAGFLDCPQYEVPPQVALVDGGPVAAQTYEREAVVKLSKGVLVFQAQLLGRFWRPGRHGDPEAIIPEAAEESPL